MSLRQRVKAGDARLLRVFAAPHHSRRSGVTRQLVPMGDHFKAWLFVSPVLVVAGGRGRRAALAGWEAVAVAGVLGKAVEVSVRRRRPGRRALRGRATAGRTPSSSSFPSTHTASAVAFAGAACFEFPSAAWVLGPLAGLVACSRPAGGRHYPSDVVGGVVVGAAAAAIVQRWGPTDPSERTFETTRFNVLHTSRRAPARSIKGAPPPTPTSRLRSRPPESPPA